MKKFVLFALFLYLLFSSSCQKQPSEVNHAVFEMIDGIEYIHNPETPLYPNKTVSFEEELSIEEEDEEGQIVLFRPGRYIVDNNENIYICDRQDCVIKVFDPSGRLVRSIGGKGQGPGEFQGFSSLAFLPDGRLLVQDWELDRTSLFSQDGQFISSHKCRVSGFSASSFYVYFSTNSSYTRDESVYGTERQRFIKTYDFSGKELLSFGEFTAQQSQTYKKEGRWFTVGKPFYVHSIVAGDQTKRWLYHCLNDKFLIDVYNQDGKLFRKIDRPYKILPVTDADIRRYIEGIRGSDEQSRRIVAEEVIMPKFKTVMQRMIVEDDGNLWIETYEEKEIEGNLFTAYDIFNEKGVYEARIWSELRPAVIHRGKMYRMHTDSETGSRSLKRYRIIWSESGPNR